MTSSLVLRRMMDRFPVLCTKGLTNSRTHQRGRCPAGHEKTEGNPSYGRLTVFFLRGSNSKGFCRWQDKALSLNFPRYGCGPGLSFFPGPRCCLRTALYRAGRGNPPAFPQYRHCRRKFPVPGCGWLRRVFPWRGIRRSSGDSCRW